MPNVFLNNPGNSPLKLLSRFKDIEFFCSGVFFIAAPCSRHVNRNDLVLLLPYIQHRGEVINFNSASKELVADNRSWHKEIAYTALAYSVAG